MDPGYETVVDPSTIIPTMLVMLVHVAFAAAQFGLAIFLIASGAQALLMPGRDSTLLRKLGAVGIGQPGTRGFGALRLVLGLALLLPLVAGVSSGISFVAVIAGLAFLIFAERGISAEQRRPGLLTRRLSIGAAAFVMVFTIWEREDVLALGVALTTNMQEWRVHELEWQLSNDVKAPKVGDIAPDFELQDPAGEAVVRLSDFRGKRPVALVFGSYT